MKKRWAALLMAALILALCAPAAGAAKGKAMTSGEAMAAFRTFSEDAAGRYVLEREEDMLVLELVPAFGRLFASVMCYMEDSLYSYYAAELSPGDLTREENRTGNSAVSFAVDVRAYSNMSRAGRYWPGKARQRLTLIGDTLAITGFQGDGEALVSDKSVLLARNDGAPGRNRYTPAMVRRVFGRTGRVDPPDALAGDWNATWRLAGVERGARMTLGADGTMTALLDGGDTPPQLLRGGYALSLADNGVYTLFYMMSALDTGAMPHTGWAHLELDDGALVVSAVEGEDCLLLPEGEAMIAYEPGDNPLTLAWMRATNRRDGEDWLDVSVRDPMGGVETTLAVRKDGGTTVAWPSNRSVFDLMALRVTIETGRELPVLYHAENGTVDLLLVLDDIAEDTSLLMARAAYFPLLGDYREQAEEEGREGSVLSVYFDEAGEPAVTLSNQTDYLVKRQLTAAVTRRVGRSYTAESEAGDSVTFEAWRADCVAVVEEALTPAVARLFPGFWGTYERTTGE